MAVARPACVDGVRTQLDDEPNRPTLLVALLSAANCVILPLSMN